MIEKATFVSFCVDIDCDKISRDLNIYRDFELYVRGMYENMDTALPLVIYTSFDKIKPTRENVIINYYDKYSLINEFPRFDEYLTAYHSDAKKDFIIENLLLYAPLVVMKLKKIVDVISENPYNSEYFFWIDSYFSRGIESKVLTDDSYYHQYIENITNIVGDKFLLLYGFDRPFGFFWGGNKIAIQNVYYRYFEIFFEHLNQEILTEEMIFNIMIKKYPELFNVVDISSYGSMYKIGLAEYLKWFNEN